MTVHTGQPKAKLKGTLSRKHTEWLYGYLLVAPTVIGVLIFFIAPLIFSVYMSLTDWTGLKPGNWIGLGNYVTMFSDPKIHRELINTLVFALGTVPFSLGLSVMVANALNRLQRGRSAFTTLYYLPNVTMPAAVALVWAWMFNSKSGIINALLGLINAPKPMWLADPKFIMPAIIIVSIWMSVGYNIIMLLAGLKNIPSTFYEAADIDGATERTKFFRITLPLLSPTLFFLLVMSVMGAFKAFDLIYMFNASMTYGEIIDASRTMVYGIYERGFSFYQMGYASAEAVLLFVIIGVTTAIQFKVQNRWVFYE